ncbi:family UPF0139 protein [Rutstroemia sp. NJR-2017a BVV2]|nr:family UPF0139 protein [Rutstroemia sp. NJR-2017a BVV2]PQE19651.1 family UPF0139 protein [Rutstroemia sp. NJR-2017a BVV2]
MSAKKDMRRADLIIPYQSPVAKESASDFSSTLGSTLPMAAMFTRNKLIGWASVVFAIQNWLGESSEAKKTSSQPAYFSVGMSDHLLILLPPDLPTNVPSSPCHTCAIGIILRHGDCGRFRLIPRMITMQSGYWKKQGRDRCGRK